MALAKPTAAEVIALHDAGFASAVVESIIDDAALLADNMCTQAYDAARQKAIVKWLAAHMIASTNNGGVLASESLGSASDSYHRASLGEGLKGTVYGQQVLLLDNNGCLSRIGKPRASIEVI